MAASKPSFKIRFLAALIYLILRIFFLTCRCVFIGLKELPKEPCVVMFWHSRLAFMSFLYAHQRRLGYSKTPYVLISSHKDGLLISSVMKYFGIRTIEGSTNRNPVRALLQIKQILEQGDDVFITPDGPRGPAKTLTAGSAELASRFDCRLILASNSASRAWQFNSWDRLILPKPFSRVCFSLLEPCSKQSEDIYAGFGNLETMQQKAGFYV